METTSCNPPLYAATQLHAYMYPREERIPQQNQRGEK